MMLANRIIPLSDFLMTSGAPLPLDATTAESIATKLKQTYPVGFDFHRLTPQQEADLAAMIIRTCRATGISSQVAYQVPEGRTGSLSRSPGPRRVGRNGPCPCGNGKKYRACCGRR
jgi:uncharacterized protein YecA (UPF0149 family)